MPYFHQAIEVTPRPAGGLAAFLRAAHFALPLVLGATLPLGACAKKAPSEAGAEKAKEHATAMARPSVSDAAGPRARVTADAGATAPKGDAAAAKGDAGARSADAGGPKPDAAPEPPKEPLTEVAEEGAPPAPGAGAANAVPLFAANPQRTWVAGGVALGAPKRCEIVDAKVRATASTLPPKTVAFVNYNGQLRGVGKDEDRPAGLHETPTLAGGLVIVTDTRGNVFAYDGGTREQKWAFKAGKRVRYSPAALGGTLFFTSDDEHLYALELATGKELWKTKAAFLPATAPAVDDTLVVFGDKKSNFYAVDPKTGAVKWQQKVLARFGSAPALSGGRVYVLTQKGWLQSLSAADGKEGWKKYAGYAEEPSILVTSDTVVIQTGKAKLTAFVAATGKRKWSHALPKDAVGGIHSPLYTAGGRIYLMEGDLSRGKIDYNKITSKRGAKPSQEAFLTALDLSTGKLIWRKDLAAILEAKAEEELSRDDHEAGKTAEVHYLTAHFTLLGAAYVIPLAPSGYALCSP